MSKKQNKPNAFSFFMKDWKKREENKGRKFPNGLADVRSDPKCNEEWKKLTDQERAYYKDKVKNLKDTKTKLTSYGESMDEIEKANLREKAYLDTMKNNILSAIKKAHGNNSLPELTFFVAHVNYFYSRICDNNEVVYCPAEIALAEFSLEKGVLRTYDKIINSKIELGYTFSAMQHSRSTHQIPREPLFGEKDYSIILAEIYEFLKPGVGAGKIPPIYTVFFKENIKNPALYFFNMLSEKYGVENFDIYSFEELFSNLCNINADGDNRYEFNTLLARMKINETTLDYKKNVTCDFHQSTDGGSNYCSKSIVQKWIFKLCSYACKSMNIPLIPGAHFYVDDELNLSDRLGQLDLDEASGSEENFKTLWKIPSKKPKSSLAREKCENSTRKSMSQTPIIVWTHDQSESSEISSNSSFAESTHSQTSVETNIYEDNFPCIGKSSSGKKAYDKNSTRSNYASSLK